MNVAQLEHAATFTDPLPSQDTLERLKALCREHDMELTLAKRLRVDLETRAERWFDRQDFENLLTQCERRQREIFDQILDAAGWLKAEQAANETMAAMEAVTT